MLHSHKKDQYDKQRIQRIIRQGEIHTAEFSDEFNRFCIPFEDSLSEEQIDVFHKILDCVSETAAAEMRAAYKVGFKDGATLMSENQI